MAAIVVQCPECLAKLKLKNRRAIGKKTHCPKCHEPFVVKPLEEPDDEFGVSDAADSGFDDDFQSAAPAPAVTRQHRKPRGKRRSQPSRSMEWKKPALIGAAGVLAVLLIGGLIWMAVSGSSAASGSGALDFAYLPPDAELIIACRLGEMSQAPILEPFVKNAEAEGVLGKFREQVGLGLEDVSSVVIAVKDLTNAQNRNRPPGGMPPMGGGVVPPGLFNASSGLIVIRTSKAFDEQALIDYADKMRNTPSGKIEEVSHAGATYYLVPDARPAGPKKAAVFFADDYTAVMGPEEDVKRAIKQGGESRPRSELDFVDFSQHLVFAAVPKDPKALGSQTWNPPATAPESLKKLKKAMVGTVKAGSFGLTFAEGIDFQIQWDCSDSDASDQIATLMDQVIADFHEQFDDKIAEAKTTAPTPLLAELVDVAIQVINSIEVDQSNTTVALTAALPGSARETFAKIPEAIRSAFQPPTAMASGGPGNMGDSSSEMQYTPFEEPEPPPPIEAVSLEAFNSGWQTQLDVQDRPAGDVLKELVEESGLKLETPSAVKASLEKPVTLKLDGVSRLEAIEQVCRQVGIHAQISGFSPDTIVLQSGQRPWPAVFAGPFLIAVTDLKENVPHATGNLRIEVLATGLPPSLVSRWKESHGDIVTFTQIADRAGRSLCDRLQTGGALDMSAPAYRGTLDISLKNLLKSVEAISVLKGNIRLSIPTQVEVLKFDRLEKGQTQAAGDVRITIEQASLGGQSNIRFQIEGATQQNIEITGFGADGKQVDRGGFSRSGMSGKASADLWFNGQPESVEVRVIVKSEDVDYAFALPEIALKSHDQMPEALAAAQFTGSEPVTGKFVKFAGDKNFRKVVFALTNHADKDIRALDLQLFYLDAGGKTLKGSPHSQRFGQTPLKQNSTQELELPAFFMPEGTKSVSARTERVTFADASVWDRADVLTDADVPYVIGTVSLDLTRSDILRAGYVGLDSDGKPGSNMTGLSNISADTSRKSVSSLTYKPRVTSLRAQDGTSAKFSHVQLIPGRYLFYVRRGERQCDWKWITVDERSKLDIEFKISDGQTGTLEVALPATTKAKQIELIPLDEAGKTPLPDTDLAKARIAYWLGTRLKPESGKAVFEGLNAGKYRVLAGSLSQDVEVVVGKTVSLSLSK